MQFKELRHTFPQPTVRVYTPNNPKKPAAVKLALKLQRLTMTQLLKAGRRSIKNFLRAKELDNEKAIAYFGARFRQVSAEHRFRVTKKV